MKKQAEMKLNAILDRAKSMTSTSRFIAVLAFILSIVSNMQYTLMNMIAFIFFEIKALLCLVPWLNASVCKFDRYVISSVLFVSCVDPVI